MIIQNLREPKILEIDDFKSLTASVIIHTDHLPDTFQGHDVSPLENHFAQFEKAYVPRFRSPFTKYN